MLREAVRIYGTAFGTDYADHPDLGYPLVNLARTLNAPGRRADAEAAARRAVQVFEQAFGAENATVAQALVPLGQVLVDDRRPADAVPVLRRAAAILRVRREALVANVPVVMQPVEQVDAEGLRYGLARAQGLRDEGERRHHVCDLSEPTRRVSKRGARAR